MGMKSDEAKIAEAVASLRTRLDTWGVEDAADKAHTYVHDMLRHGWRPRSREVELPPKPTRRVPAEDARVCWCSLNPARCKVHEPTNPDPTTAAHRGTTEQEDA